MVDSAFILDTNVTTALGEVGGVPPSPHPTHHRRGPGSTWVMSPRVLPSSRWLCEVGCVHPMATHQPPPPTRGHHRRSRNQDTSCTECEAGTYIPRAPPANQLRRQHTPSVEGAGRNLRCVPDACLRCMKRKTFQTPSNLHLYLNLEKCIFHLFRNSVFWRQPRLSLDIKLSERNSSLVAQ